MQFVLTKKTDIKIYILYVMKNVGCPIELAKLLDGIVSDGAFSSLSFSECFFELCDAGNIEKCEDGNDVYRLTGQGENVVNNLFDTLIPSAQRSAIACATRITELDGVNSKITYNFERRDNGGYIMHYTVIRANGKLFAVDMKIENEEQKNRIEYNLKHKSDRVYKSIMAILNGDANFIIDSQF